MPLYEYECDACGQRFEVIQRFADAPADTCAKCGKGPVHRLPSSPAIQFKGSGWYITDYAQKGKSDAAASSDKSSSAEQAGKSEKADGKAESKGSAPAAGPAPAAPKT